jgi:hypothetical protein
LAALSRNNIEKPFICGAMSQKWVDSVTRAHLDMGFHGVVAEAACTTRDWHFPSERIEASVVHAAFLAALSAPSAQVVPTESILLKGPEYRVATVRFGVARAGSCPLQGQRRGTDGRGTCHLRGGYRVFRNLPGAGLGMVTGAGNAIAAARVSDGPKRRLRPVAPHPLSSR